MDLLTEVNHEDIFVKMPDYLMTTDRESKAFKFFAKTYPWLVEYADGDGLVPYSVIEEQG